MFSYAAEKLGFMMRDAVKNAIAPLVVDKAKVQCQEVVHLATDEAYSAIYRSVSFIRFIAFCLTLRYQ